MTNSIYDSFTFLFVASVLTIASNLRVNGITVLPFVDQETVSREITLGVFVGNEKYVYDEITYPYCSRAIFQPEGTGSNKFLTWLSNEGTCEEAGVDQVTGKISGDWFGQIALEEVYAETVESNECMGADSCEMFDILTNKNSNDVSFGEDYDVKAVSCGRNHKNDLTGFNVTTDALALYCDAWQLTLLERKPVQEDNNHQYKKGKKKDKKAKKDKKGKKSKDMNDDEMPKNILVLTITYGDVFSSVDSPMCPETITYNNETLGTPNMRGAAQLVLQGNITSGLDPCEWDCFEGKSDFGCM
mmetsp:Transcript_21226/g.24428  ORF Transcript_21226/g.24428 Transcript_21226/m.24428 type:complete len:301 (-) Transcript_21226:287-1189(-)